MRGKFIVAAVQLALISGLNVLQPVFEMMLPTGEDILIGLGFTGSGKSTTLNLIGGYTLRLYKDEHDNRLKYRLGDGQPDASPIGTNYTSSTITPQFIRMKESRDMIMVDVPGIADNRGVLPEIIAAFGLGQVLEGNNRYKSLLTIDEQSLTFPSKLDEIVKGIGNLGDEGCNLGLGLVVTKVTSEDADVDRVLKKRVEELLARQAEGAEQLACAVALGLYRLFPTPDRAQELGISLENTRSALRDLVGRLVAQTLSAAPGQPKNRYMMRKKLGSVRGPVEEVKEQLAIEFGKSLGRQVGAPSKVAFEKFQEFLSLHGREVFDRVSLLGEVPGLEYVVKVDILRFVRFLRYLDTDWARELEGDLGKNIVIDIKHAVDRIRDSKKALHSEGGGLLSWLGW